MGAAVSARAEEVAGQSEKMKALYARLGVDSLGAEEKAKFEVELGELYERHGGERLFLESDERKQAALLKLFEREAIAIKSGAGKSPPVGASDFRKKRLSYSMAPAEREAMESVDLGKAASSGERARRPSLEFRSPEYDPMVASPPPTDRRAIKMAGKAKNKMDVKPDHCSAVVPYPESILGTFSYHGIEPKHYGTGVVSKINQDRGCVVMPYNDSPVCSLFCVFDGHGEHGDAVSEFVLAGIVADLEEHPDLSANPELALKATFLATDMELARSNVESYYSGTTAVVCYRIGNHVYTANSGDSRAVLARKDGRGGHDVVALSVDQNPNAPGERERIEGAGGFVSDPPEEGLSARVWLDRKCTQVGLAMARSIGDNAVKRVGVIAEPEVLVHEITKADDFLIMATDGVWEFIPSEEAVAVATAFFEDPAKKETAAKDACKALIDLAVRRWRDIEGDYRDDITAIVMRLSAFDLDQPRAP